MFNLKSLNDRFGKALLKRNLTRYMLDFMNIKKLIFDMISTIS